MVFDVAKLMPKERKEIDSEKRKEYAKYYAGVLERFGYRRDKYNDEAFSEIADYFGRWFAGTHSESSMPEKGMFLFGEKGTGKTTALRIFSALFKIEMIKVEDLTIAYTIGREEAFWKIANNLKYENLIVDDVCNESIVKSFGNALPMPEFLKAREDLWKYNGIFTFYSSNANCRDEITALYGDTITSRILGSCEFIQQWKMVL